MPLYEYECEACGKRFELIRKFSDPPVEVCFSCAGPVRKLLSSPAIQFKGTGWYITDYARKGASSAGASDSGEKKGTSSDAGSSSSKGDAASGTAAPAAAASSSENQK